MFPVGSNIVLTVYPLKYMFQNIKLRAKKSRAPYLEKDIPFKQVLKAMGTQHI